jgi:hypothetical protein
VNQLGFSLKCSSVLLGRHRCRANTRSGFAFCYFHDPSISRERHLPRKRVAIGRSSHKLVLSDAASQPLSSVPDVLSQLETTANEVRRGQLETRLANCMGYLCSVALNGLAQMPKPDAPVAVSFIVQQPVPCPQCKAEAGKECADCHGMGYLSAPETSQEVEE